MYYWRHKAENGATLEEELLSCKSVSRVAIASAFLSPEGVHILQKIKAKYSLRKEQITLYLSAQFSSDKPHEILEQLSALCETKIVFEHNFHPKVYLLRGKPDKLIYGSSNFTEGGMAGNVEFNHIGTPLPDDLNSVDNFFSYCERIARKVDPDIIQYYKDIQDEVTDLHKVQMRLKAKLTGYTHQNDPFSPDDYDIGGFYFNFKDYETFFPRNEKETGSAIMDKRIRVQKKMLDIDEAIYARVVKMGIAHHKRKENITSLIIPHHINRGRVGWLGVRYGKKPAEVDFLNAGKQNEDDTYGFQKHGCLQYNIGGNGFDVSLFLAVRHGAIDRGYLHEHIDDKRPKIESELLKLKGENMVWVIWDRDTNKSITFDIDSDDPSAFCEFFKENDHDGLESYMQKFYDPDDMILQTKESIGAEILRVMKLLLPLYNTIVWRPRV